MTKDELRAMPVVTIEEIIRFRLNVFTHISDLNMQIKTAKADGIREAVSKFADPELQVPQVFAHDLITYADRLEADNEQD